MRRVWAAVLAVWALLALVTVLAWSRPPTPATQGSASVAVVRTANGLRTVVLPAGSAHATTQTSPTASAGQPVSVKGAAGQPVLLPAATVHASTGSS
jgi:flagellar hook-length control protein FliK